jgi:cell division protein ZapA (FtsZ GTPase activity inhibitor)
MKNQFDTLNTVRELVKMVEKWQDIAIETQDKLIQVQEELEKAKEEVKSLDRNWDAYCGELEDKMREQVEEMKSEMINNTNREDLL